MKFWYGSGSADPYLVTTVMDPDPAIFISNLQDGNKKLFFTKFFCLLLFEATLSKNKSHKEVTKQLKSRFFFTIFV
jgi:hypothetical protein